MYTWIVLGMLIASGDERLIFSGVPLFVAVPEYRFVPHCRVTFERPGSSVKLIVDGATPLDACATSAALVSGTLNVSFPLPRLLMRSDAFARPRLHSSTVRNTVVDAG